MTLSRREKIMIVVGLIVVTLTAYAFYFVIPYVNDTGAAIKKLNEAQSQIQLLNTKKDMAATLTDEIATLQNRLKNQGASLPEGIDHARCLLYLQEITDGRAADVNIAFPKEPEIVNNFLTQASSLDFRTSYTGFQQIVAALKENKLYNRVTFLKADYAPAAAETPADSAKNVLQVHIELSFYALQPTEGTQPTQPLKPSNKERGEDLFPSK